jgi:hypothetical protein
LIDGIDDFEPVFINAVKLMFFPFEQRGAFLLIILHWMDFGNDFCEVIKFANFKQAGQVQNGNGIMATNTDGEDMLAFNRNGLSLHLELKVNYSELFFGPVDQFGEVLPEGLDLAFERTQFYLVSYCEDFVHCQFDIDISAMIYSCLLLNIIVLSRDIISLELLLFSDIYFTLKSFSYSRQSLY